MVPPETKKTSSPVVVGLFVLLAVALSMGSPFTKTFNLWNDPLVSVGNTKIYEKEFQWLFMQKLRMLSSSKVPESSRTQYALEYVLSDVALREEISNLGIRVSDRYVKDLITRYPEFQNKQGNFSERKFREHLKEMALGLREFFRIEKERVAKRRLQHALLSQFTVPLALKKYVEKAVAQRRVIRWKQYTSEDAIGEFGTPSKAVLHSMYKKEKITSPMYKVAVVLKVDNTNMIQVEEELSAGHSLDSIAKRLKLQHELVSIKNIKDLNSSILSKVSKPTKQSIYDKISRMQVDSDPENFQDGNETYIVQIHRIEPEKVLDFKEAKPLLEAQWLDIERKKCAKEAALKASGNIKSKAFRQMNVADVDWLTDSGNAPKIVKQTALKLAPKEWRVVEDSRGVWLCYLEKIDQLYITSEQNREISALLQEEWKMQAWNAYIRGLLKQYHVKMDIERIKFLFTQQRSGHE